MAARLFQALLAHRHPPNTRAHHMVHHKVIHDGAQSSQWPGNAYQCTRRTVPDTTPEISIAWPPQGISGDEFNKALLMKSDQ